MIKQYLIKRYDDDNDTLVYDIINYIDKERRLIKVKKSSHVQGFKRVKKPVPNEKINYVGIELEFISKLTEEALQSLLASKNLSKYVQIKGDGSIEEEAEYPFAYELNILVKEKDIKRIVSQVTNLIARYSMVNESCGLHVHLDMRNRVPFKSFSSLYDLEKSLYQMVPSHRRNNNYCTPISDYNMNGLDKYTIFERSKQSGRHKGINVQSLGKHNTIEIRMHDATLNSYEITNWCKFLIEIINKQPTKVEQLPNQFYKYYLKRKRMYA